jgi:hypothetical protein
MSCRTERSLNKTNFDEKEDINSYFFPQSSNVCPHYYEYNHETQQPSTAPIQILD